MSELIEETKTVTPEAYSKCREGNRYLVIPKTVMDIEFQGMSDMADGLGGYHSLNSLKETLDFSWGETKLTDDLVFVHYCFDSDDEENDVEQALTAMGLVQMDLGKKIRTLTKDDLVANGFLLCSSLEIKYLQTLANENVE